MAAIDKIYVNSYEKMFNFRDWLKVQPKLEDKYGKKISLLNYFFDWWDNPEYWKEENAEHPIFSAPCYVDAYIIRNCPLDYIQKELMLRYGHKTQEDINEMYHLVVSRTEEENKLIADANGEYLGEPIPYWWLSISDFRIDADGVITMPKAKKSAYQQILDNEIYTSPSMSDQYVRGKHFKIIKLPFYNHKCNYPIKGWWLVTVKLPDYIDEYITYSSLSNSRTNTIGTWDFTSEFVGQRDWFSSTTVCKSLHGIKRRILKWKLPVGTIVTLSGRYVGEEYKIIIKK